MSAIDRVRKSRGINELAAEIEPLAQSMATLADEARQRIAEVQQASEEQAASWTSQQQQAMSAWREAAGDMRAAAGELTTASQTARSAARGWTWRLWAGVLTASVMPILVLLIASWLWLEPQIIEQQGGIWLIFKLK
ncbi:MULTISPECIES: IncQ-type mobilization protein MobB [Enterobacteriaceae]|uniref:IncQ-type mobilization protein MobB n=1 Tax=Enterobacteriaceae TaxID=543 RepID=UPI0020414C3F|nr:MULTISPECIES: IncQ-type mobilization protein MobB [Enterobacteriaceae]